EIARSGIPGHIGRAGRIDRYGAAFVGTASAEHGSVTQDRIDNQWEGMIVRGQFEVDTAAMTNNATFHLTAGLIDTRQPDVEIATAQSELNSPGVRSWSDDEIELQLARIAVVDHIDPRINVPVAHAAVIGNMGTPLPRVATRQVVAIAGQQFLGLRWHVDPGAQQAHSV